MLDAPTLTESQPAPSPPTTTKLASPEPSESESKVTVHNGRRRGRRRVMKKQKVKDEEGYLGEQVCADYGIVILTPYSNQRGSRVGVFLRGRTRAQEA